MVMVPRFVLVNVQVVSAPGATTTLPIVPLLHTALVRSQPAGTVSLTLYPAPGARLADVKLAVPPRRATDLGPSLLWPPSCPSPPTVFFTTLMVPRFVLVNVQVVSWPATTTTAPVVPLLQTALERSQPACAVSLMLY